MTQVEIEERCHNDQLYKGEQQSMGYGVPTAANQVCETRDRSHKGMLDGTLPALDGDHIGHSFKSDAEVRPDCCPNEQVKHQVIGVNFCMSECLRSLPNVGHAHGVHDIVDQPDHFPGPVTLAQVPVALEKGVGCTPLV